MTPRAQITGYCPRCGTTLLFDLRFDQVTDFYVNELNRQPMVRGRVTVAPVAHTCPPANQETTA